jgi:NADP-dependent 3-hydroxy acid dehydrogenase YdfG
VIVGIGPAVGSAIAKAFAREGYLVMLLARSEESLEAGMSTVGRIGGQSESMKLDVADTAALWSKMPRL